MYNLCLPRVIVTVLFLALWPADSSADRLWQEQFIREAQKSGRITGRFAATNLIPS